MKAIDLTRSPSPSPPPSRGRVTEREDYRLSSTSSLFRGRVTAREDYGLSSTSSLFRKRVTEREDYRLGSTSSLFRKRVTEREDHQLTSTSHSVETEGNREGKSGLSPTSPPPLRGRVRERGTSLIITLEIPRRDK
jgi:hypothetical protein